MRTDDLFAPFRQAGVLDAADEAFARMLARVTGHEDPLALLGAALAFRAPREGHVCLDVTLASRIAGPDSADSLPWPDPETWRQALAAAPFVRTEGEGDTPLVLDGPRLYLERYSVEETRLAREVLDRVAATSMGDGSGPSDPVERAADLAARGGLVLLTGGPGTGKTTAAARILAALARAGRDPGRFSLLAPTGKAASRLAEAVREGLSRLDLPDDLRSRFPMSGMTLHRALGLHPDSPFAPARPRDDEAVVVDEASMMDLVVATRLFQALPRGASVILLGDPHQLASVEAGAVFADLCEAAPLAPVRVHLRRSFRFGGAIADLADAVVHGDEARVREVLRAGHAETVFVPAPLDPAWRERLRGLTVQGLGPYVQAVESGDSGRALQAIRGFRILCAVRRGPFGCEALNEAVARWLNCDVSTPWFAGRVVLVTQNDPDTGLFNGDTGVVLKTADGPRVFFEGSEPGSIRSFAPSRLPPHEDAFAVTIHKSQGSQADAVAVVLPPVPVPILTRELLYTAVTRARQRVTLFALPDLVALATRTPTVRASGLRARLDPASRPSPPAAPRLSEAGSRNA